MTVTGVALAAGLAPAGLPDPLLSHVPIVIGTSPGFPLLGGVERVLYASVMLVLLVTARSVRLAVDDAPNTAGPMTTDAVLHDPTDLGRVA